MTQVATFFLFFFTLMYTPKVFKVSKMYFCCAWCLHRHRSGFFGCIPWCSFWIEWKENKRKTVLERAVQSVSKKIEWNVSWSQLQAGSGRQVFVMIKSGPLRACPWFCSWLNSAGHQGVADVVLRHVPLPRRGLRLVSLCSQEQRGWWTGGLKVH